MRFLFVHPAFPGQFRYIVPLLAAAGHEVVFATASEALSIPGVEKRLYNAHLDEVEPDLRRNRAAQSLIETLRPEAASGYRPDLIVLHAGHGYAAPLRTLFPETPVTGLFEWFFETGRDVFARHPSPPSPAYVRFASQQNRMLMEDLAVCGRGFTPTEFQRRSFPADIRPLLDVVHEGTDARFFSPAAHRPESWSGGGISLHRADGPVISYVSRAFEPVRQFHTFFAAMVQVLERHPGVRFVLAGSAQPFYGEGRDGGERPIERLQQEFPHDTGRVYQTSYLPLPSYRDLLRFTGLHVYLTRPFVPSWSFLEAQLCGCCVVSNQGDAARAFIRHRQTGWLTADENPDALAEALLFLLQHPEQTEAIGKQAALESGDRFSQENSLSPYLRHLYERAVR